MPQSRPRLPAHLCLGVLAFIKQSSARQEPAARTVSQIASLSFRLVDLWCPTTARSAESDVPEQLPSARPPTGRCKYRVTFSPRLPDINAIAPLYYHGNLSHSIRLNKWRFPRLPSLATLYRLPPRPLTACAPRLSLLLSP